MPKRERFEQLTRPSFHARANRAPGPQEPDPNCCFGYAQLAGDLLHREAVQLLLKEHPVPWVTELEDLGRIQGSQINSDMPAEIGQSLVARLVVNCATMVVQSDRVDPAYDRSCVPELVPLLPASHPSGLRNIFCTLDGRASEAQKADCSNESLPIRLAIFFLGNDGLWRHIGEISAAAGSWR
jgi:hypothetical protein